MFALILRGLCGAIAARGPKAGADLRLIAPALQRVGRLSARFLAVVAAFRAGRLIPPRPSPDTDQRPAPVSRTRPVSEEAQAAATGAAAFGLLASPKLERLPARFGWMLRFGSEVACHRSQLEHWLTTNPELGKLLAAAPHAGRILRPLCHMLGIPLPPALRLPPRPPGHKPEPAASASSPMPSRVPRSARTRPSKAEMRSWLPGQKRALVWSRRPATSDNPPFALKPA